MGWWLGESVGPWFDGLVGGLVGWWVGELVGWWVALVGWWVDRGYNPGDMCYKHVPFDFLH